MRGSHQSLRVLPKMAVAIALVAAISTTSPLWSPGHGTGSSSVSPDSSSVHSTYSPQDSTGPTIDTRSIVPAGQRFCSNCVVASVRIVLNPEPPTLDPTNGNLYVPSTIIHAALLGQINEISGINYSIVRNFTVGYNPNPPAFNPWNDDLYVSNNDSSNVTVISGSTNQIITTIPVGSGPQTPTVDLGNGNIFVANLGSNNLSVISWQSQKVTATIAVGVSPQTPVYDAANSLLYVSNFLSSNVSIISGVNDSVVKTVPVGLNPLVPELDPSNGDLYVSNSNMLDKNSSYNVSVISTSNQSVISNVGVGCNPNTPAYDPLNGNLYVSNRGDGCGNVTIISGSNNKVVADVAAGRYPEAAIFDPVNGDIYVDNTGSNTITVISGGNETPFASIRIGGSGTGPPTMDPGTGDLYISDYYGWNLTVIATGDNGLALAPTATASSTSGVAPLSIRFSGSTMGGVAPYVYSWNSGSGLLQNGSALFNCTYRGPGSYSANFTVRDAFGQSASTSIPVQIWSPLIATASASGDLVSVDQSLAFSGAVIGGLAPFNWTWMYGDGTHTYGQNTTHTFDTGGTYVADLWVNDSTGQTAHAHTVPINVAGGALTVFVAASRTKATPGQPITFSGSAFGGIAPYRWEWRFGDGILNHTNATSHSYSYPGTYVASLWVTDSGGASASGTLTVVVVAPAGGESGAGTPLLQELSSSGWSLVLLPLAAAAVVALFLLTKRKGRRRHLKDGSPQ